MEHRIAAYRHHIHRMHTLPLDENKKMERMANHPKNREKQQCTDASTSKTQQTDTTKIKMITRNKRKKNWDHIHIPQPKNKCSNQFIQEHKHKNSIQDCQYNTKNLETKKTKPHTRILKKRYIQNNM